VPPPRLLLIAPTGVELREKLGDLEFLGFTPALKQTHQFGVIQVLITVPQQQIFGGGEVALPDIGGTEVLGVEVGGAVVAPEDALSHREGLI
jgi:hypothetical protein